MRQRRIFWRLPEGATHGNLHMGVQGEPDFLGKVDRGEVPPLARIDAAAPQQYTITDIDVDPGAYQFAVVSEDATSGKFSDPYQAPEWVAVPLDNEPLAPPFGGGLSFV
jgi:hypothetical protein